MDLLLASDHVERDDGAHGTPSRRRLAMDRTACETMVETWVTAFGTALNRPDIDRVLDLFEPEGFWRDLSALTWNVYTATGYRRLAQAGAILSSEIIDKLGPIGIG